MLVFPCERRLPLPVKQVAPGGNHWVLCRRSFFLSHSGEISPLPHRTFSPIASFVLAAKMIPPLLTFPHAANSPFPFSSRLSDSFSSANDGYPVNIHRRGSSFFPFPVETPGPCAWSVFESAAMTLASFLPPATVRFSHSPHNTHFDNSSLLRPFQFTF